MNTNPKAKRILCFGDSNTWGRIPDKMGKERFDISKRWTGILQTLLGNDFEVIEEGLGARTTNLEDPRPEFPERNGLQTLTGLLESHLPIDLFVVMLGTTNLKILFAQSALQIKEGLEKIIELVQNYKTLENTLSPKILVIVPPVILDSTDFAKEMFAGGTLKALEFKNLYKDLAEEMNVEFLDPTDQISVDEQEGIHLTEESHRKLGTLVAEKVKSILTSTNT